MVDSWSESLTFASSRSNGSSREPAGSFEGNDLVVADPAFGADDEQDLPDLWHRLPGQGVGGLLVEHEAGGCALGPAGERGRVHEVLERRNPGPPALFHRRPDRLHPSLPGLGGPIAAPPNDGPVGLPRDDPIDAELGGHLDRRLVPVGLGQRLGQRDRHCRRRLVHHVLDGEPHLRGFGRGNRAGEPPAGTVGDVEPLPRAHPFDCRSMSTLRPRQDICRAHADVGQFPGLGEEEGKGHGVTAA